MTNELIALVSFNLNPSTVNELMDDYRMVRLHNNWSRLGANGITEYELDSFGDALLTDGHGAFLLRVEANAIGVLEQLIRAMSVKYSMTVRASVRYEKNNTVFSVEEAYRCGKKKYKKIEETCA